MRAPQSESTPDRADGRGASWFRALGHQARFRSRSPQDQVSTMPKRKSMARQVAVANRTPVRVVAGVPSEGTAVTLKSAAVAAPPEGGTGLIPEVPTLDPDGDPRCRVIKVGNDPTNGTSGP